jgi:hypothetical protein
MAMHFMQHLKLLAESARPCKTPVYDERCAVWQVLLQI